MFREVSSFSTETFSESEMFSAIAWETPREVSDVFPCLVLYFFGLTQPRLLIRFLPAAPNTCEENSNSKSKKSVLFNEVNNATHDGMSSVTRNDNSGA